MASPKVGTNELARLLSKQQESVVRQTVTDIFAVSSLRKKIAGSLSSERFSELAEDIYVSLIPALSSQKRPATPSFRLKKARKKYLKDLSPHEVQQLQLILFQHAQAAVLKELLRQPAKLHRLSSILTRNIHHLLLQSSVAGEKRQSREISRAENKYSRLLKMASDAIVLVEYESGMFVEVNEAACRLTGYTETELKQTGLNSLVSVFDLNLMIEKINDAVEQGAVRFDNLSIFSKKRNPIPVDVSATAVLIDGKKYILAIIRDIKERKKIEFEIQQKALRLQLINEVARAISSADLAIEAVLTSILKSIARVIKVEAGSILKLEDSQLIFLAALGEKAECVKPFRLKLGQGIAGWVAEHEKAVIVRDVHKDERYYPQVEQATGFVSKSILAAPMKIGNEIVGVIELINKVGGAFTKKDLELMEVISSFAAVSLRHATLFHECTATQLRLSQLRSPITASRLAGVVAREMKDPLGIVKNYIRILDEKTASAESKGELAVLSEEVDRIANITDQLLNFSEAYFEEPRDTPINLLIENTIASARDKLQAAGIKTKLELEQTLPEVVVIPNQMNMVFSNLVRLAMAEMPHGGTLAVCTRRDDPFLCVEFSNSAAQHSPAEANELFLPSGVAKGLVPKGLGLYMVHNIIQSYGGDIKVVNTGDGGSVFSVSIPLNPPSFLQEASL
ncbi:MAG: PAS domain S-box protein [Candidatus Abyssobacteria bacterium SURF_5]|uniref:histidine kinase n=1 Tax=Abyssobacteria bacterium (strain SURF_5) TaxID=2093360 RepID=A0A3A4P7J0_ABYX5|nr:MAG: PAS domain S-box protein [Candidatus Abyssubacteria bacterium SURF_5]